MRRLMLAAGVVCAAAVLTNLAGAQVNTMPGQVVGSGYGTSVVGQPVAKAAPQAGEKVNLPANTAMMRRYDPNRPYDALNGTSYTRDQVGAPIPGAGDQSLWSKFKSVFVFEKPTQPVQHSTYFPSLSRRNKERNEAKMWRRD